jgi:hypothetical protein
MLLMIVNAGLPLVDLQQVGADAAGTQIPGSSAKTPICDFRGANEITIGHSHLASNLDLMECGAAAEEGQPLHDHTPALFYRRAFDAGEATICRTLFSRGLSTTGRRTSTAC